MKPVQFYGIKNCDTVKKARAWLDQHAVPIEFHDFKSEGLSRERLERWLKLADWETLLNRRGMMWRKLSPAQQAAVKGKADAVALMLATPTIVKRPVLETGNRLLVGFDAEVYASEFGKSA